MHLQSSRIDNRRETYARSGLKEVRLNLTNQTRLKLGPQIGFHLNLMHSIPDATIWQEKVTAVKVQYHELYSTTGH